MFDVSYMLATVHYGLTKEKSEKKKKSELACPAAKRGKEKKNAPMAGT